MSAVVIDVGEMTSPTALGDSTNDSTMPNRSTAPLVHVIGQRADPTRAPQLKSKMDSHGDAAMNPGTLSQTGKANAVPANGNQAEPRHRGRRPRGTPAEAAQGGITII